MVRQQSNADARSPHASEVNPATGRLRFLLVSWVVVAVLLMAGSVFAEGPNRASPPAAKPPAATPPASKPPAPAKPRANSDPAGSVPNCETPGAAPKGADATASEAAEEEDKSPLSFPNESLIERDDGTVMYFYRTNFTAPVDLIKALTDSGFGKLLATKKGAPKPMRAVTKQNVVIFEGDFDAVQMVLDAVAYFDVAQPQVFVEAKVIEVTYESNFEFGLDYLMDRNVEGPGTIFRGTGGTLNPPTYLRSTFAPQFPFQGTSGVFGLVGKNAAKWGALEVTLQALQLNGKAEVLSKPSIIATQGIEAIVTTTESTPVIALNSANRAGETFGLQPVKTGVELKVKPEHIGESFVTLKISPKVDGVAGLASARTGGTFAPITTTRKASTTLTLGDGETLVIGGLYTNFSTTEKAKTPLFSEIPVLGHLFTRTKETKRKTELIFILTPHIVRKTKDLKIITPPAELDRLEKAERAGAKSARGANSRSPRLRQDGAPTLKMSKA